MVDFLRIRFLLIISLLGMPTEYSFGNGCTDEEIDSLQHIIQNKALDDLQKADAFFDLGECMLSKDLDSARYYAEEGFHISDKEDYQEGIARYFFLVGKVANIESDYSEAKIHYTKVLDLYQGLIKDEAYLKACNSLAYINELQSEYEQALEWYHQGLESSLEQNNLIFQATFYNNIATTLMKATRYRESLPYMFLASSIFEKLGNEAHYGTVVGNIAIAYLDLNQYDSAMHYLNISGDIAKEQNSDYGLLLNERSKGDVLLKQGDLSSALDHYKSSLEYAKNLDQNHHEKLLKTGWAHYFYGHALMQAEDLTSARMHLYQAKDVGDSLEVVALISESAMDLSKTFEKSALYDSALHYQKLHQIANDTLLSRRYNAQVDHVLYESQAKLQQIKHTSEISLISLKKQRRELIIFLLLGMTISLLIVAYFIWKAQKSKIKIVERDHQLIQLENEKAAIALERKRRELTTTLMNLAGRNEFVSSMNTKLKEMVSDGKSVRLSEIEQLISMLNVESGKLLWNEFEISFIEVHTMFFEKLNRSYPDLTANERRLCAFLYLNMTTKEISSITQQSEQSIKIARYRLRKKAGLEKNASITRFLQNLN